MQANYILQGKQKRKSIQAAEEGRTVEPYWGQLRMRDDILSAEHNLAIRQRLWSKVSKIVETNDNIRSSEIEHEVQPIRVWSWSGNADTLLEVDSPRKQLRFDIPQDEKVESVYPAIPTMA